LKPKNIYWKSNDDGQHVNLGGRNGSWKIGDFGLATWSNSPDQLTDEQELHSMGVGTFTYASPEQLRHDCYNSGYGVKTDVYSLGIILFELLVPMRTGMERAENLRALRQGILPEAFMLERPKEVFSAFIKAALILWMMAPEPENRPSVSEIMALDWFAGVTKEEKSDVLAVVSKQLEESQKELEQLRIENNLLKQRILVLEENASKII
jgi:serine/threonine protein kinase